MQSGMKDDTLSSRPSSTGSSTATKKLRRSTQVVLVLMTAMTVAGCSDDSDEPLPKAGETAYRDRFDSLADCRADWDASQCEPRHEGYGFVGPYLLGRMMGPSLHSRGYVAETVTPAMASGFRSGLLPSTSGGRGFSSSSSSSSSSVSRGGFGESGGAHGSSGGE